MRRPRRLRNPSTHPPTMQEVGTGRCRRRHRFAAEAAFETDQAAGRAPPCKPVSRCTSQSPGAQFGSHPVLLLLLSCSVILKPNNSTFMAFCPVLKCAHISRESYESLEFHDNLVEGQIHQQTARGSVWKLSCHRHLVHSMALPISISKVAFLSPPIHVVH